MAHIGTTCSGSLPTRKNKGANRLNWAWAISQEAEKPIDRRKR